MLNRLGALLTSKGQKAPLEQEERCAGVRGPNGMTFWWWPGVLDGAVCTSYPLVPVRVSSPSQLSRESVRQQTKAFRKQKAEGGGVQNRLPWLATHPTTSCCYVLNIKRFYPLLTATP